MVDRFAVDGESRFAVVYHPSSLGVDPEKVAHVGLLGVAVRAVSAFSGEDGEDVVSWLEISYSFSNTLHNTTQTNKINKLKSLNLKSRPELKQDWRDSFTLQLHVRRYVETKAFVPVEDS